jgi:hypothetical protein
VKVRIAASAAFPLAFTPYTIHYTLYTKKQSFEIMKKVYMAPQTEAIELLVANAIMAVSGFAPIHGTGTGTGTGEVM